jgi:hypothetical protein
VASGVALLMEAQSRKRRHNLFPMQATESVRVAGDEEAVVAGRRATRRKREGMHELRGQSAVTQIAPKFVTCLRRHRQAAENVSGRWAEFFPAPVKIGSIQASAVRLRRAVRDTLAP